MLAALLFCSASATPLNRVSFYTPTRSQTDSTPHLSACGPTVRGQIGVSRDLLKLYPCGTWVKITLQGGRTFVGPVWDTMNPRYSRSVDVMLQNRHQALRLGVTTGTITRLR